MKNFIKGIPSGYLIMAVLALVGIFLFFFVLDRSMQMYILCLWSVYGLTAFSTNFEGHKKSWGYFRTIGIFGSIITVIIITFVLMDFCKTRSFFQAIQNPTIVIWYCIFFAFILSIAIGEILRYLDKIRSLKKNIKCPRCNGTGFVDLNDIKRLGMEEFWHKGGCNFCERNGSVHCDKMNSHYKAMDVVLKSGQSWQAEH